MADMGYSEERLQRTEIQDNRVWYDGGETKTKEKSTDATSDVRTH